MMGIDVGNLEVPSPRGMPEVRVTTSCVVEDCV